MAGARLTGGVLAIKTMERKITLGSLFDGIGGFPYAALFYGIQTLWASEIIPSAVSVTRRHFPSIEHLGDITKLKGGDIAPVDIITFGSPCQSFSFAGQRRGLEGKSGLFWEAIRIIREMREATNGQYPRYCVFENVPGILSANKGRDYKTVLEALTETEIPLPPSGRWTNAGMVRGGRIDCAWVIHDAQYFGVAQRRRRLFAVCDFTGQRAAEILFKPKSLHWHFAQGGKARENITAYTTGSIRSTSRSACINDIASTLVAGYGNHWNGNAGAYNGGNFALIEIDNINNINNKEYGFGFDGKNAALTGNVTSTLGVNCGNSTGRSGVVTVLNDQGGESVTIEKQEISPTLRSEAHGNLPIVSIKATYPINTQIATRHNSLGNGMGFGVGDDGAPAYTLQEARSHAVATTNAQTRFTVRRLTPLECERLQGFPDGWTEYGYDSKPLSDTARYQALGNSVAIPCVAYILSGIVDELHK